MKPKNPFSEFLKILFSPLPATSFKNNASCKAIVAGISSDLSLLRKWVVASLALLSISLISWGQVNGDYQTRATGNWNANTTWQVRSGGIWVNCAAGDYPGAAAGAGTVNILVVILSH